MTEDTAVQLSLSTLRADAAAMLANGMPRAEVARFVHETGATMSEVFPKMTPTAAAVEYAKLGWRVVPTKGKRPSCGDDWQHQATSDPAHAGSMFRQHRHDGVGVLLGESSGIIDIECDDPLAEETLLELFDGLIPLTPTFGSTRGKHRLFRWSDQLPVHDKAVFKIGQLEFRTGNGNKGAQTVFPPSGPRKWLVSPDECDIAEIPDNVIERIKARVEKKPTPKPHNTSSRRSEQPDVRLKRAAAYLAKIPPAISGQGGHDHTFATAIKLVAFGLSRDDVFGLLSDWNRTCEPPWTDAELWHKIDGAIEVAPEAMPDRSRNSSAGVNRGGIVNGEGEECDGDLWTDIGADQGRTELANARRFVAAFGDVFRFCHPWQKSLVWDGTRWKLDDDGAVQRMAATVADAVWHEVACNHTKDNIDFAEKTSKASGINAMLKLAASMRPIRVDELDANHWLLNCQNGTVDLRTGELRPHRREDNLTKLCPTNFNSDATTYVFDHFLDGVFGGNATLIGFLQRLFGYCLTGDVREQCLPVFHGSGANGKSTLLTAIQDALGIDYSTTAPPSLLMEKKTDAHPTELAGLFGKRLVIAQETSQGARLAESTVKQLTGGDRVSARRMREDFWEFTPTHKLILCTNHKPRVKGTDHAIWRRLLLIPFANKFWNPAKGESGPDELRQDKELPAKLKAEAEGILTWMVQGCLAWQRDGLQVPDIVRAATEVYRSESDTVGRFVAECCLTVPSVRVKFSALYSALESWCEDAGDSLPSRKFVGEWLRDAGFREHANNGRWYIGVVIKLEVAA